MLGTRVLTAAIVLVVLVAAALLATPLIFDVVLLVIVGLACYEWGRLLGLGGAASAGLTGAFVLTGAFALSGTAPAALLAQGQGVPFLPIYLIASFCWVIAIPLSLQSFETLGGKRWTGKLLAFVLLFAAWGALLQADGLGKGFLLSVLLIVWVADTAAYFAGRAFGKRKLAPRISPGKTWEGVAGALIANLLLAVILVAFEDVVSKSLGLTLFSLLNAELGFVSMLLLTLGLTLISVAGDLYESLLKRLAGVKDSGRLLPGHGGVLDRIDALIAVMPVAMAVVSMIQSGIFTGL